MRTARGCKGVSRGDAEVAEECIMRQIKKPEWWPDNPYPESIFPMKSERYPEIVPDPELRTALSGCLGRIFWGIAVVLPPRAPL